ncbi:ribonuclease J [Candidatus Woesebacteria bacterium]|nr:MAG: ribonuclease J [Candidatus Woesebacteria bacterium]
MDTLKFIGLSGTTGVTQNMYIYEYGNDMMVVDCGVGFPDADMFGVDLVIPDFSYVRKNRNKLKGVLITHGHEDHIGALPFFMKEFNVPIYSTRLVSEFIKEKLKDHGLAFDNLKVFNPESDVVTIGSFRATPFYIAHSIPDGVGFAIETPKEKVFHVADYKFDWTPVTGHPFDAQKAAHLAVGGVDLLVSDSLGSMTPGFTESEINIEERIEVISRKAKGKIFFTTISSNISRIQQALNVATRTGRYVSFIGFSIDTKAQIAKRLGFLNYPKGLVVMSKRLKRLKDTEQMYIISGGYGQAGSALYKVAMNEHKFIKARRNDMVIFSSDPAPPGTKESVDFLVDRFITMGLDVHYYDTQEDLHVSGHGSQEDIKTLFGLVRPKYFIPVGGTIRHNRGYATIAKSMGAKQDEIFELSPGDVVEFVGGKARRKGQVSVKTILVDGLGVGDVGSIVLRDRQLLAQDGIVIVHIQVDKAKNKLVNDPEIISRGFVFEKAKKDFLIGTQRKLREKIEAKEIVDKTAVKNITLDFLDRYFYDQTGRHPMILPVVVEI